MPHPTRILLQIVLMISIGAAATTAAGEGPTAAMNANGSPQNLLFIHHSCGGQLFADPGQVQGGESRDTGEYCIHVSHPNGGGLRGRLEAAGYTVNEASYGSIVGQDTDICHWREKFATQMDRILHTRRQDTLLPDDQTNQIVCFKSCYPNNRFTSPGTEPGDPDSCDLTLANARAAYRALLPLLHEQPDVLFVAFTAPPMAEYKPVGLKAIIKSWFNRGGNDRGGALAREFNAWLTDRDEGWLAGYDLDNIAVFDHYGVLVGDNASGYSAYPSRDGRDSHPSREGNQQSASAFMPFLENAATTMNRQAP